jgi:hypothetical protein
MIYSMQLRYICATSSKYRGQKDWNLDMGCGVVVRNPAVQCLLEWKWIPIPCASRVCLNMLLHVAEKKAEATTHLKSKQCVNASMRQCPDKSEVIHMTSLVIEKFDYLNGASPYSCFVEPKYIATEQER